MNIAAYLQRVGYQGSLEPTLETLTALHRHHLFAIPFENLDIHLKRPLSLALPDLFAKIVERRRGGFCFEQNGLFAGILRELGYQVTLMECNVYGGGEYGIPRNHLALRVDLDQAYLVDVGFGDNFYEPLKIHDSTPQQDPNGSYKVTSEGNTYFRWELQGDEWQMGYRFFLTPRQLSDFEDACVYMQTSPQSHFTQKRICSLARPNGRISLSDLRWIVTRDGEKREILLEDEQEYTAYLERYFGIQL